MSTTFRSISEHDVPAVSRMAALAFAGTAENSAEWIRDAGLENSRVLEDDGRAVASMLRIPMGQFFGGRSVPMIGIAGVAVAPEARGRGYARTMMRAAIREMHEEGTAISCLYPSTQTLYRQANYEQAGHRCIIRIPLAQIDVRERAAPVAQIDELHRNAVHDCYREFAAMNDGWLDRGDFLWKRVSEPRGEPGSGFAIGAGDRVDGYAYFQQRRRPDTGRQELLVNDVAFRSAEAGRRLLGFFADFATVAEEAVFAGGPHHPLMWLLGQQRYSVARKDYWMLALTNVERALAGRGYSTAVRGEIDLEVVDDVVPENGGRYRVRVEDGRAEVERRESASSAGTGPGGSASARLHVRALASLYTGFTSPRLLRALGDLEADERGADLLTVMFAGGGAPAMCDAF
jgi:predicted acetyltransferase